MVSFFHLDQTEAARPTAMALGCFDGVHLGHQKVLRSALTQREDLCPGVFTFQQPPSGIRPQKGGQILSQQAKYRLLEAMGIELLAAPDFLQIRDLEPEQFVTEILLKRLKTKVVCCGSNFRFGRHAAGDVRLLEEICRAYGVKALIQEQVCRQTEDGLEERISSTAVRQAIADGRMEQAAQMLGRPYLIDFQVVHGRMLGRTLDFPTINQPYPESFCLPRFGVYATVSQVDGQMLPSVTNVGVKPTVGSDYVLAETFIVGCEKDLYGREIPVYFLKHLREEQKFSSLEALRAQIRTDTQKSVSIGESYMRSLLQKNR